MSNTLLYPKAPIADSASTPYDDTNFRRQVRRMITSLAAFCMVYLLTIGLGAGMAAACMIVGGAMVVGVPFWLLKVVGLGLVVAGFMVLFFLIKFIFENKKTDRTNYVEIFPQQYPLLFEFIERLCAETQTQLPKHVYVSPEVNAAVFYDQNLLSMFLPVRKNLVIGLGVVNVTNMSEFKAVLAHEFGHFSQKSMKAGSYVYQMNRVIYNSLYDNDSYISLLNRWASIHSAFALCAQLTFHIVNVIRWINKQTYNMLNVQYNSLSKEMEFHADAVSASVSGSNNMISALRTIDAGDTSYNSVLNWYNGQVKESKKGRNLYTDQRIVQKAQAAGSNDAGNAHSRVSIMDQWMTHPTLAQRENSLQKLGLKADVMTASPWELFNNDTALQERLTDLLYKNAQIPGELSFISDDVFENACREEIETNRLPAVFGSYFANRDIAVFEPDNIPADLPQVTDVHSFCVENSGTLPMMAACTEDIGALEKVIANPTVFKKFSFEGEKYDNAIAPNIISRLKGELEQLNAKLYRADIALLRYFLDRARQKGDLADLQERYSVFFAFYTLLRNNLEFCNAALADILPFYEEREHYAEEAKKMAGNLDFHTITFKDKITATQEALFNYHDAQQLPEIVTKLLTMEPEYISDLTFHSDSINMLHGMVMEFGNWNEKNRIQAKKQFLEHLATLA